MHYGSTNPNHMPYWLYREHKLCLNTSHHPYIVDVSQTTEKILDLSVVSMVWFWTYSTFDFEDTLDIIRDFKRLTVFTVEWQEFKVTLRVNVSFFCLFFSSAWDWRRSCKRCGIFPPRRNTGRTSMVFFLGFFFLHQCTVNGQARCSVELCHVVM